MKKCEHDVESKLGKEYVDYAKIDSKNADLFIINNKYQLNRAKKGQYWYTGEYLCCGLPRNDILYDNPNHLNKKVKDYFNIELNKKIVLYAPTFREDHRLAPYDLNTQDCIEALKNRFSDDWVMLIRLHPNMLEMSEKLDIHYNNVYNASYYDDMAELLAVSDVLISDYSGSLYDFPLTNRPCFIYASDYEEYKLERDLEFDLSKVPYPLSCNNEDLQNNIINFDHNKYLCQLSEFHKVLGDQTEGMASKQIVSWISNHI